MQRQWYLSECWDWDPSVYEVRRLRRQHTRSGFCQPQLLPRGVPQEQWWLALALKCPVRRRTERHHGCCVNSGSQSRAILRLAAQNSHHQQWVSITRDSETRCLTEPPNTGLQAWHRITMQQHNISGLAPRLRKSCAGFHIPCVLLAVPAPFVRSNAWGMLVKICVQPQRANLR